MRTQDIQDIREVMDLIIYFYHTSFIHIISDKIKRKDYVN